MAGSQKQTGRITREEAIATIELSHLPTDVYDAARRVAQEYVDSADKQLRGVPALSAKLGMPAGTLYNKLNCNESSHHKLTLADVIQISVITGDARILKALALTLEHVCFPVPRMAHVSDVALLELITNIGAEGGGFYCSVNKAFADRRFELSEYVDVRRAGFGFIAAIVEAMSRMEGLIDA